MRGGSGRLRTGNKVAGVTLNFFFFPTVCTETAALLAGAADVPVLAMSSGAYDTDTDRGRDRNETRKLRIRRILPLLRFSDVASAFIADRSDRFLCRKKISLKPLESDRPELSD